VKAFKEFTKKAKMVHEEYLPVGTTDFTAGLQRMIDKLKDQPGRKSSVGGLGGQAHAVQDRRHGPGSATASRWPRAATSCRPWPAYKNFPGMEGALYYYFGIPKNPVNEAMVAAHYKEFKAPPDFFTAGGFSAAMAIVTALKATNGDTNTNKLIQTMEGMSFDTPKGKMTFRKEDHQAMQSMYHFKIKADPAFAWGVPELVREIKPEEMNVPIRNKR
jgi:branched-chain amino acid transport system substrate-binding protein